MTTKFPLRAVSATGEVQGGRQRNPKMKEGIIVPYLRVANVFDGYIDFSDVNEMAFRPEELKKFRLQENDILLNEGQSIDLVGRAALYEGSPADCCYQNTLVRYRAGPDVAPHFAIQLFRYCQQIGVFSRIAVRTSSIAHLGVSRLADLELPFPSLSEQREIANILGAWDEALEKLNRLRTAYESRLLGLRDSLMARASRQGRPACFGDFLTESRIPGSNGATARKISVRLYGKGTLEKNGSRSGSANTRYYRRKTGQIIWSKLDFLNGAFALIGPELDGCESTLDLPAFDCDPSVNPVWLIEYLTRPTYYTSQIHLARGQRKARRIAPDDWLASTLRLPDRATQNHIADILSCARKELALIDAEIDAVTRQKRGLMQKLLTGEWRVAA